MGEISTILKQLRAKLDRRGMVKDPQLARRIVCRSLGAPADRARVVFRRPASSKGLRALAEACQKAYGVPPPSSLLELYEETDGLWACAYRAEDKVEDARMEEYEEGIQPVARVIAQLVDTGVSIFEPDGTSYGDTMSVLPIVASDVDWIAMNPWSARADEWPVVMYDHEEVDNSLPPRAQATRLPVIEKTLAKWLRRWIDAGFNLSLVPAEEYGAEQPDDNVRVSVSSPSTPPPRPPFVGEVVGARVLFIGPQLVLLRLDGQQVNVKLAARTAALVRNQQVRVGLEDGQARFVEWMRDDGTTARLNELWFGSSDW